MAGFSTDYSEVKDDEYGLIPEGVYEVIIRNIEERTTKKGKTGLNLSLVIRNDVEQKYKDRYLFHTLWKRKEPTPADMQVQGYSFKQLMQLAKSAKLPSGKAYETVQQLCEDMLKKPLKVTVGHETTTYNDKEETREIIKYINESKFPECNHVFKEKKTSAVSETFASQNNDALAFASGTATIADEFEEILADGDVPF